MVIGMVSMMELLQARIHSRIASSLVIRALIRDVEHLSSHYCSALPDLKQEHDLGFFCILGEYPSPPPVTIFASCMVQTVKRGVTNTIFLPQHFGVNRILVFLAGCN